MDPVGGFQALQNLRLAGNEKGRMFVIPNAGHHGKDTVHHTVLGLINVYLITSVYLDNPSATNDLLVEELNLADQQQ